MLTSTKKIFPVILAIGALLLGWIVFFFYRFHSASLVDTSVGTPNSATSSTAQTRKEPTPSRSAPATTKASPSSEGAKHVARDIFNDKNADLRARFSALWELSDKGDVDARHLAYQIEADCSMYAKMSPKTYLPSMYKPEMGVALARAQADCSAISSLPEYQNLAKISANAPRDAFDQDIRDSIRRAFADNGEDQALSSALATYANRPDATTARLIASTLAELDITNLDKNFFGSGAQSEDPNYRRSMLETALNLLSCDYGVPCGPDSAIVTSLCINGGICSTGYDLDQIYEKVLLSGENMQNVRKILDFLRQHHH